MSKQSNSKKKGGSPLKDLNLVRECLSTTIEDCKIVQDANEEALEAIDRVIAKLKEQGVK